MSDIANTIKSSDLISANQYVELKLKRNSLYLEFFEKNNELLKYQIIVDSRIRDDNLKKIKLFEEVNIIENKQLSKFDMDQENITCEKYKYINEMTPDIYDMMGKIRILNEECNKIQSQIYELNNQIPQNLYFYGTY